MSEEPTPPKPKPGSLRDRIAAFEKKPDGAVQAPPQPRPKPGGLAWKPRPRSPPATSSADTSDSKGDNKAIAGGSMSASDAKESIGKLSLKERMAALQGQGAFGQSSPPAPPKPSGDKPKWKPPPRVVSLPQEKDEGADVCPEHESVNSPSAKAGTEYGMAPKDAPNDEQKIGEGGDEGVEDGPDPDEEDRQRRAALAARMARLGGARVGMAPPVFGKQSSHKKPEKVETPDKDAETTMEESTSTEVGVNEDASVNPSPEAFSDLPTSTTAEGDSFEQDPLRKSSTSSLSVDSKLSSPSMPVPVTPRRAAPPRKKPAKSLSPAPQILDEGLLEDAGPTDGIKMEEPGDVENKVMPGDGAGTDSTEDEPTVQGPYKVKMAETAREDVQPLPEPPAEVSAMKQECEMQDIGSHDYATEPRKPEKSVDEMRSTDTTASESDSLSTTVIPSSLGEQISELTEEPAVEPEGEDEAARRKRVTEQLTKMGAFNPLTSPPPHRQSSTSAEAAQPEGEASIRSDTPQSPPLPPQKRTSLRKGSADSGPAPLERRSSARKTSVDSTASLSPVPSVKPVVLAPLNPEVPARKASVTSVGSEHAPVPTTEDTHEGDESQDGLRNTHSFTERDNDAVAEGVEEVEPYRKELVNYEDTPSHVLDGPPPEDERQPARSIRSSRQSMPPPAPPIPTENEQTESAASPRSNRRSIPPPPPPAHSASPEFTTYEESESSLSAPPRPPRRSSPIPNLSPDSPASQPPPPDRRRTLSPPVREAPPTLAIHDHQGEVLDEEEGDPIDPAFYTPNRSPVSSSASQHSQERIVEPEAQPDVKSSPEPTEPLEDPDQIRRRTIAERMAKLGGIKFGAPIAISRPPVPNSGRPSSPQLPAPEEPEAEVISMEEEELARKQRIANKLAGMGGMRIGMLPPGAGGGSQQARAKRQSTDGTAEISSHSSAVLPPPSQMNEPDSENESLTTSDDGVKVEAEESELEEVTHEDAQEQDLPPPVPSRAGRSTTSAARSNSRSAVPGGRPPVPVGFPTRKDGVQARSPSSRKSSTDTAILGHHRRESSGYQQRPASPSQPHLLTQSHSEYVMVDDPKSMTSEEAPPLPPPRATRPPARGAPPPPGQTSSQHDGVTSQWELPSIPTTSLDFGGNTPDLSLSSWSEDSTSYPPPVEKTVRRASTIPAPSGEVQVSSEALMAIWGKVGVQVCEAATVLYDKSKKTVVGDGSYVGFVHAVISQVPNAAPATLESYGYLIYTQSGASVQRRSSEILPGDVIELHDAKFKGHKGLQNYVQNVGSTEAVVGVISEYEVKKSKIRVFQANQHVGQQTVESASYRLEDLRSGTVKIFRVLEA